jgi:hypothetical protein
MAWSNMEINNFEVTRLCVLIGVRRAMNIKGRGYPKYVERAFAQWKKNNPQGFEDFENDVLKEILFSFEPFFVDSRLMNYLDSNRP